MRRHTSQMRSLLSTTLTKPTGTPMTRAGRRAPASMSSAMRSRAVGALPTAKTAPGCSPAHRSTAAAARMAAANPQSAAIGNGKLADMTGLSILARRIEDEPGNWTRFVIIGPKPVGQLDKLPRTAPVPGHTGADKTSMLFTLPDKSGALSGVLSLLAEHKINMRKLESRPLRGQCWKYVFFTDVECDLTAPQYEDLLRKLAETCTSFRILGSYATGPQLDRIGLDDVEDSHA